MFLIFVVCSLATYRVTRFVMHDTLIERQRTWLYRKIAGPRSYQLPGGGEWASIDPWRNKILELLQCWWCLSLHVAWIVTVVADQFYSIPLPGLYWLALGTVALATADVIQGS